MGAYPWRFVRARRLPLGSTARIVQVRQHANGRSRYEVEKAMGPALVISLNEDG